MDEGNAFVTRAVTFAMESTGPNFQPDSAVMSHFENVKPKRLTKHNAVNASINMWAAKTLAENNIG
jgi:hypothetical protein